MPNDAMPNEPAVHDAEAWSRCREALAIEVARVATLLRTLPHDRPGRGPSRVGEWDMLEVAVHLSQAWVAIPGLSRADLSEVEAVVPDSGLEESLARSVGQLGAVTTAAVAAETERNPAVLADRIEQRAGDYLADCRHQCPDQCRPWVISGITVPPNVFTAHLLSETMVHGWDIARAAGRPWRIDPGHAALVVRWFVLELLLLAAPALVGDPSTLATLRGRYLFDLRGRQVVRMVLDERGARLDTAPGPPDCRMSLDPVAFLLMFFGRRGLLGTAARGGVLVWGRKPWLGLRLQSALPTP